jgi:putative transposase
MARPLRIEYPGALYHITSRGNGRQEIFKDDEDRETLLDILASTIKRYNWLCHAYCLMDTHYHLIVETPEANLSSGMRQLNGVYTQRYNRRHKVLGHLFQGRYKAILVEKENYLLELCRYVMLNPVRAEMVRRPEDWRWSSYAATAGMKKGLGYMKVNWILSQFGDENKEAEEQYKKFVMAGINGDSPWQDLEGQVLLGGEDFKNKLRGLLKEKGKIREIPKNQRYLGRPKLEEVFGVNNLDRKKRNEKMHTAHVKYGYKFKEIAEYLRIHYTTISKALKEVEATKK